MNFSKLKKAILEIGISKIVEYAEDGTVDLYDDENYDPAEDDGQTMQRKQEEICKKINALNVVIVHEAGGFSGGGEDVERIFVHRDKNENIYIKLTGSYSSYEGIFWDDTIERVMPETHTVTIYTKYKA